MPSIIYFLLMDALTSGFVYLAQGPKIALLVFMAFFLGGLSTFVVPRGENRSIAEEVPITGGEQDGEA